MVTRIRGGVLHEPVCRNVEIVGHSDMDGRTDGLQMQFQEANGRQYLYVGHFWSGGTTILDVTDPASPTTASFIPTPNKDTWSIKVQVADNIAMIPTELNFFGLNIDAANARSGVRFFDVSAPTNPKELSFYEAGGIGVHRSWWNGGKYAYLSAGISAGKGVWMHGAPEMTRVMTTVDASDPSNPRKVSEFWLPEQKGEEPWPADGATVYCHQPTVEGDRCYVAYWDGGFAILDISTPSQPRLISRVKTFPEFGDGNVHTCLPLPEKQQLVVIEENTANFGGEGPKNISLWDISDEANPSLISTFPSPVPSAREPYEEYVKRGDRFGPHCLHENHQGTLRGTDTIYATYCNAGLRVYDIADAKNPREVASFVPPDPELDHVVDPRPYDREFDIFHGGSRVACTQDVLVDPRGYIYLSGTNDGIWIVKTVGV
jgi:hypothetical protein